ncbi:hypothetical protein MAR_005621 [Mya arenaria]|uniref:Uncharacterized protein n=1 Tax=Mya arenaria TaxID=6604 RepID=A0ABY7F3W8_MYAAR|nr:hypothetical protein MAR_005621 [Mya arenaria]
MNGYKHSRTDALSERLDIHGPHGRRHLCRSSSLNAEVLPKYHDAARSGALWIFASDRKRAHVDNCRKLHEKTRTTGTSERRLVLGLLDDGGVCKRGGARKNVYEERWAILMEYLVIYVPVMFTVLVALCRNRTKRTERQLRIEDSLTCGPNIKRHLNNP